MSTALRKRARSMSSSDSDPGGGSDVDLGSPAPSSPTSPAPKYHRAPSPDRQHLCTLPPTCSQPDTAQRFATLAELEAHQANFHQWVCRVAIRDKPGRVGEGAEVPVPVMPEHFAGRNPGGRGKGTRWRECGKVFPDGRLLDLHETETHDPLARERIERGEKIFACFLPPEVCGRTFYTPKKRRWHLINDHQYPKDYFFAITNHGLNQLTRTDGLAASLIRPRREFPAPIAVDEKEAEPVTKDPDAANPTHSHGHVRPQPARDTAPSRPPEDVDVDMDALTSKMAGLESSLSFIPRNVARRARQRGTRMEV